MVWTIFVNLRVQSNLNIEKIIFKVVQIKFLAMHINNQKLSFDIFTVQNIFMEHDFNILMIFGITEQCIILTHTVYCCLFLQICCLWLSPGIHIECEYFTLLLLQLHFRSNKCSLMSRRLFFTNLNLFVSQRRRSAEDELSMRDYLQEGDLISVSSLVLKQRLLH